MNSILHFLSAGLFTLAAVFTSPAVTNFPPGKAVVTPVQAAPLERAVIPAPIPMVSTNISGVASREQKIKLTPTGTKTEFGLPKVAIGMVSCIGALGGFIPPLLLGWTMDHLGGGPLGLTRAWRCSRLRALA